MTLLTGSSGQLGVELQKLGVFYCPSQKDFDVVHPNSDWLLRMCPSVDSILHCAADTRVTAIQTDPKVIWNAVEVNVLGTLQMALLANELDVPLYHISTETCLDPYNTYAKTKLLAEDMASKARQHTILRTSFRSVPFEYDKAFTDQWTIGDSVEVIAGLIVDRLRRPTLQMVEYIGTGAKTIYDLAKQTRPDVKPISIDEVNKKLTFAVKSMEQLRKVQCLP